MAIAITAFWVYLSGIGGFVWQNSDHVVRNPLFRLLVAEKWPLVDSDRAIVYYLGFWLPAAVAGKIGGLTFGLFFEQFWAVAGILLFYSLWCARRRKLDIWPLLVFIFFSGMDYFGLLFCQLRYRQPLEGLVSVLHLEGWFFNIYQYSSVTTQLFWVFNQAIPVWLAVIFLYSERNLSSAVFVCASLLLSSTLPALGLAPFMIWLFIKNPKELFTFQNIVGGFVAASISFLYLSNNSSARAGGAAFSLKHAVLLCGVLVFILLPFFFKKKPVVLRAILALVYNACFFGALIIVKFASFYKTDKLHIFVWHMIFIFVEVGALALVMIKKERRDSFYWIALVSLFLIPLVQVGRTTDFCMRASIPALLMICILAVDYLSSAEADSSKKLFFLRPKFKKAAMIFILLVGALTPVHEFYRTILYTVTGYERHEDVLRDDLFFEPVFNTSGAADNLFFKRLAKTKSKGKN
ncbi:MAG: hypothetical protein K6A42_00825 [Treponema sp.]|nr:hypothetical protein [Treponema sp.]